MSGKVYAKKAEKNEKSSKKQRGIFRRVRHFFMRRPKNRAQLLEILRDSRERNILSPDVFAMIERVFQVADSQVRDVMIPRSQMIVLDRHDRLDTILSVVIESAHSRYPVMEGQAVAGMMLAKDLLPVVMQQGAREFSMADILRPAVFVPQSKRLDILLREFRANRNHMAVVVDEYGQVSGLVTIEDVLEEIVGEIEDEYDVEEEDGIAQRGKNVYSVKAATAIEAFNARFATRFSDEEFDTVGGLVLKAFGYLPKRGESIEFGNYRFRVIAGDGRRIHLLEVRPLAKTRNEPTQQSG